MQTLAQGGPGTLARTAAEFVNELSADWEGFVAEYRWAVEDEKPWLNRLEPAIGPTFGELGSADRARDGLDSLDPSWLTSTVVELAGGIDVDQDWDRLPIPSDALQEAGCDRAEVVDHCLAGGPHSRGRWVMDLTLARLVGPNPTTHPF